MTNQLHNASSLYLRQHAEQPVHWYCWGPEAFDQAKKENKPVLVSVGYAACHWCHVMSKESFSDPYIADLMNKHFICIKVDREERPDVDQLYMEAVQMVSHQGGWPLNAFCLPDGKPFFGGTYFPAKDIGSGIVPWPQVLIRIADYYKRSKAELVENAENILKNLSVTNTPAFPKEASVNLELLTKTAEIICTMHDDVWGGFGKAPKFPAPMILGFLMRMRPLINGTKEKTLGENIDKVVNTTLQAMAHGGIYDQLAGGFMRYSVDDYWIVPHFEKMLYDNALLIGCYTEGFLQYRNPLYKRIVTETIAFLDNTFLLENGLYAASLDADNTEGEGRYYTWTADQIYTVLGMKQGTAFCQAFNVLKHGNCGDGHSVLTWTEEDEAARGKWKVVREKLLQARNKRPNPARDNKILLAWNSLLAKNLAIAGFYFQENAWLEKSAAILEWMWQHMRTKGKQLLSVFYAKKAFQYGFLDDYAFYLDACLTVSQFIDTLAPRKGKEYLERAKIVQSVIDKKFRNEHNSGYYFTPKDVQELAIQKQYWWDNAQPSGQSALVHALSALYALTQDKNYAETLQTLRAPYGALAQQSPGGATYGLTGFAQEARGIAILKLKSTESFSIARKILQEKPMRPLFLHYDPELESDYQLCIGSTCLPNTQPLKEALERFL